MIKIESQGGQVFVGTPDGERYLAAPGVWSFDQASYVSWESNSPVNLGQLRDGASVLVDGGGLVTVVDGPDLVGAGVQGFALAVATLGLWFGIRSTFRRIFSAMSASTPFD